MTTEKKVGADYNFKSYSENHLQFATRDKLTTVISMAWLDHKSWPLYGYINSIQTLPKGTRKKDILSIVEKWKSKKQEYMNHTITPEEAKLLITEEDYQITLRLMDKIISILETHAGAIKEVQEKTHTQLGDHRADVDQKNRNRNQKSKVEKSKKDHGSDDHKKDEKKPLEEGGTQIEVNKVTLDGVTADDENNKILGFDEKNMELAVSTDGGATYGAFSSDLPTDLSWDILVKIRSKKDPKIEKVLTFTKSAESQKQAPVSANVETQLGQSHTTFLNKDELRRAWETYKTQPLTPEQQKQEDIIQKNLLYIEFAKTFHQIASDANESKIGLGWLRISKDQARTELQSLGKGIEAVARNPHDPNVKNKLMYSIRNIDKTVGNMGKLMGGRVDEVEKIIEGPGTSEAKYADMINFLRGGYIKSGTTNAGDIITHNIIAKHADTVPAIKSFRDVMNNTAVKTDITNASNESEVRDILIKANFSPSLASDVADVWRDINKNLESNKLKLIDDYKKKNPTKTGTAKTDVEKLISEHVYGGAMEELQRVGLREIVKHDPGLRSDPQVELFAQAEGVGTWSPRDSKKAAVTETAITFATVAIPMGFGIKAGRAVAGGIESAATNATARTGMLGSLARWVAGMESAEVGAGRVAQLAGKGLPLAGESFTFTESYNIMTNLLYKDSYKDVFDGGVNLKENVKNFLFFRVLNVTQKLFGETGALIKAWDPVPLNIVRGAGQILTESTAIWGVGGGTDAMFGDGFHPTWEEFFQAMLMASLSRRYPQKEVPKGKVSEMTNPEPTGKQSVHSRSNTVDLDAQARIDAEHGIGREKVDHGYGAETGKMEDALNIWAGDHSLKGSPNKGKKEATNQSTNTSSDNHGDYIEGEFEVIGREPVWLTHEKTGIANASGKNTQVVSKDGVEGSKSESAQKDTQPQGMEDALHINTGEHPWLKGSPNKGKSKPSMDDKPEISARFTGPKGEPVVEVPADIAKDPNKLRDFAK